MILRERQPMKFSARPQLLIFDLDGTLAHTLPQLVTATQRTCEAMGTAVPSLDQIATYIGNGNNNLLARAMTQSYDAMAEDVEPEKIQKARELFNRFYLQGLSEGYELYPGVVEALTEFKALGIKLGVATNKAMMFAEPLLKFMGLYSYFDCVLGGEVIKERKPDPAPLYYVCDKCGARPELSGMVGDSANDFEAGHNAHMTVVAFTFGYNRGHDVRESNPDYVFDDYRSFAECIKKLPAQMTQSV